MNEQSFWRAFNQIREELGDDRKVDFDSQYLAVRKTPVILYGLNYFLGWLGVDRFMLGHWGLGIGKLIVAGLIPFYGDIMAEYSYNEAWQFLSIGEIWVLVDFFLIGGATRRWNNAKAVEIAGRMA